jgi:predicted DsbA family dithiol-disulfide isomerase
VDGEERWHGGVAVDRAVLRVEVFADVACPWCYIGEKRLETALALAGLGPDDVRWSWRPFELQPDLPSEGVPWADFVTSKFGGESRATAAFRHVEAIGALDGLEFHFDRITRAPNTRRAQRLILLAERNGRGKAMAETLFRAYFCEGRDISDPATLMELAAALGIAPDAAATALEPPAFEGVFRGSREESAALGITGVPFFIFNDTVGLSGAQSVELFTRAIEVARSEPS